MPKTVMENCNFSHASYIICFECLYSQSPIAFLHDQMVTSKHIFEVGVQIFFGFSIKVAIDLPLYISL